MSVLTHAMLVNEVLNLLWGHFMGSSLLHYCWLHSHYLCWIHLFPGRFRRCFRHLLLFLYRIILRLFWCTSLVLIFTACVSSCLIFFYPLFKLLFPLVYFTRSWRMIFESCLLNRFLSFNFSLGGGEPPLLGFFWYVRVAFDDISIGLRTFSAHYN